MRSLANSGDLIASMQCKFPSTWDAEYESLISMIISITPVLVNRLVLSLKRAADVRDEYPGVWNAARFSEWEAPEIATLRYSTGSRMGTSHRRDIPLKPLIRHGERTQSSA